MNIAAVSSSVTNLKKAVPSEIVLPQREPDCAKIVQISDLHLFEDPSQLLDNLNPATSFHQVLALLQQELANIDLLLVSGDLVHEISEKNYQQVFDCLDSLGIPYQCIAGNHDVTQELDPELPFEQRRHIAMPAHHRLASRVKVSLPYWDILLTNSAVAGQVYGKFDEMTLDWLQSQLTIAKKPCVIVAHHPMVAVNARWIDSHQLQNADKFWQVVSPYADIVKAIFVGHIHHENHVLHNGIHLFSTPSTCVQFAPFQDDFTTDTKKTAGLRWITLYNNANLATGIKRIDTM